MLFTSVIACSQAGLSSVISAAVVDIPSLLRINSFIDQTRRIFHSLIFIGP